MASGQSHTPDLRRQLSKRLRDKRRKDASAHLDLPEHLRESDESSDEDAGAANGPPMSMNMNQSIFGLIAAAGTRVDFNERFDESSSEGDDDEHGKRKRANVNHGEGEEEEDMSKTTILKPFKHKHHKAHRRKLSGHRLLKSLPVLPKLKTRSKQKGGEQSPSPDSGAESDSSAPDISLFPNEAYGNRLAPVMSRILEGRVEMSSRPSFDLEDVSREKSPGPAEPTPLARKLKEIFKFDEPEQVVNEYPCWLLQNLPLQGFLYLTAKHICFYAYLPKKSHEVAKSGYLSKSGRRSPKYSRFWFRLKGDVLSYYQDSTNLYFPHGQIDLSYGILASISEKDREGLHFEVVTKHRTYNFRADSAPSAKEWVKSIQRVIFRSHNDGDSVKISLPTKNIIDVEETQMMEFAETCKIRVIDNDETYAIDEFFFSFFTLGREAIDALKLLVEDASLAPDPAQVSGSAGPPEVPHPPLQESVKATLPPTSPASASGELSSRSFGSRHARRSSDLQRSPRKSPERSSSLDPAGKGRGRAEGSSESNIQSSVEDPSYSNIATSHLTVSENPSASQILRGSEVFQSPSMLHPSSQDAPPAAENAMQPRHAATMSLAQGRKDESPHLSSPSLQNIAKIGTYPLQRAGAVAGFLGERGKRMGTLLATESMGYVEKVSGMWKGGGKHYDQPAGLRPDDDDLEEDSDGKVQTSMARFRAHFALPESEMLEATYFGCILRVLPLYGKIYISDRSFCFRSLLPGTRTKLILPLQDIENVHKENGFRFGYSGLVVVIRGHEELFFEFGQAEVRDDCTIKLLQTLEKKQYLKESGLLDDDEKDEASAAEQAALKAARQEEFPDHEVQLPHQLLETSRAPTVLLDGEDESTLCSKLQQSVRITCLTIGSRGDVQPYIALCKGLLAEGHKPRIATHAEFQGWIESHGIQFARVEGDPGELMRLCIENGTFTWAFLREANAQFRGWLDELLDSAYEACKGSDVLIESPSAMAGIHIAEKLAIPYFRAFTMPWTRTRAYPHAFVTPEHKMGGAYNYMTYVMFDSIFWRATSAQINRWRNKSLSLPNTSLEKMQPNKVPFMYNFSPHVVAPPLDYSDWIRVTGYWFLDEGGHYDPPEVLQAFIKKARNDGKKLVYVGFGSIIVNDPAKMTQEVINAVQKADVRCILSKGWSDRVSPKDDASKPRPDEPPMPPEIHVIKSAPHDWLFRQIDAAAHHGGSGTTGASLRAGIPTIIRPFFGDQFFFASRVEDLGVGVWVKKWGTQSFARALWQATREDRIIGKARALGEQIRKENGVQKAIDSLYRDMEYARSLIKRKNGPTVDSEGEEEVAEESWTFIGSDQPDPDMFTKKLSEGLVGYGSEGKALGSQALKGTH